jgi:cytochrome c oxidase cbb3-type subunit 4
MNYDMIRQLADSWGLLAMFLFFIGVVVFAFRPGSKTIYEDVARIPLKNDSED